MPSWGMIHNLTTKNWPKTCAEEETTLNPITLIKALLISLRKYIESKLITAPIRLKKKVGPRKVPKIILATNTLNKDTHTPVIKSYL